MDDSTVDTNPAGSDWGSWLRDISSKLVSGYTTADAQNRQNEYQLQMQQAQVNPWNFGGLGGGMQNKPAATSSLLWLAVGGLVVYMLVK